MTDTTRPHPGSSPQSEPFAPRPGAPRWYVRRVAEIMSEREPAPAEEFADGWHVVPWDDGVAVQRIQDGCYFLRPERAGAARDRWDEALRADREHLAAHGLEVILSGSSQTVVRVPEPGEAQTTAILRWARWADSREETSWSVRFEGHAGPGGYVLLDSTQASAYYKVVDHRWDEVWVGHADRDEAVTLLAHHYGLPAPVRITREA